MASSSWDVSWGVSAYMVNGEAYDFAYGDISDSFAVLGLRPVIKILKTNVQQ